VFEIPTESDAAYRAYVAGRVLMARRTPADLRAAVARFEEAFALDPGFGIAYAFHTQVALQLPHETPAVAQSALTKAHQLAPNAPATHLA
jgi:hypothetical protein